ncbi:DinB family protein [Glutamicibacter sp. JL.03c]|uniref:DinB family protein n=1 Tax=Glutamicibacter sp. JL.03c TaxID=2984842 RepID=UPI0021F79792|nr:DinB family protein [Glutamicibacter sp. JL.03c]UYQ76748.1 DinB family protein [Glutamicibacter sp. JL.03c]
MPNPDSQDIYQLDYDSMAKVFIDQHRQMLMTCLDGLTEEEARANLVESKTTLLGLVKHATFVERVWFGEAATGRDRSQLGIAATPDSSFALKTTDTIESVQFDYALAVEESRQVLNDKTGDDVFQGNRRGSLPVRWVLLHMLRELAQHCGHADILREQILTSRKQ